MLTVGRYLWVQKAVNDAEVEDPRIVPLEKIPLWAPPKNINPDVKTLAGTGLG